MDKFTTLSVTVTEEIDSNKVLTFIRTQIKLQNILLAEKSCFYFKFLPKSLRYEILLFQNLDDLYSSPIFFLSKLCDLNDQFTLFITSEFFTLYQNKELLVVKKVSDIAVKDIESYIEQTYKIKPTQIVIVQNSQLQELLDSNKKDQKQVFTNIHKVTTDNAFKYFLIYLSICIVGFIYAVYNIHDLKNSQKNVAVSSDLNPLTKELIVYKKHSKKNISKSLTQFLDFIANTKVTFKNIEYLGNNLSIKLTAKKKKQLLKILEYSKKRISLKSIQHDTHLKQYIMDVILYD